jgi:carboxypeptidase family protein
VTRHCMAGANAFFCLSLALASPFVSSAQTGGAVQGRVISSLRGEPVAGVIVNLREMQTAEGRTPQTYICQTGADGRFSVAGMMPGIYDPHPSKQGYETRQPGRPVSAHDFSPITVEAGQTVAGLEFRLIPDSVIAGRVLDADGDPVRYAQVEAQQYQYVAGKKQLQQMRQAQTNDRGEYRIFFLAPGRYYLRATSSERSMGGARFINPQTAQPSEGLAAAYYPGVIDAARATELTAPPGGELGAIDIRLVPEKRYSIRGKMPTGGGGVRLTDRGPGNFRRPQYFINFTNGGYEIRDVEPGSYWLIADSVNRGHQEEAQHARQAVDVIDRDVDGVDITFLPGVKLQGTVKVEGAAPLDLQKMQVMLQTSDFSGQQQAKIAADGSFSIQDLSPGTYQIRLAGRDAYVKSIRSGDRELPDRTIDTEHLPGDLTVAISGDFGRLEGTVADEAGKPVYNANVTLIPDQGKPDWQERFRNVFTMTDGNFKFANILPGEYQAFAWFGAELGAPQSAEYRKPYEDRAVRIKVEANGHQSLDLKVIVP